MRLFAHNLSSITRTEDIRCDEEVGFDVFNISKDVLRGLEAIGFKRPSPVQLRAIPYGRCGVDMVVQSKSGTGKTCVFAVVALDSLDVTRGLQVIILAPTHEIAQQDSEVVQAIGRKIPNLVVTTCIGGQHDEKKKLKSCHVLIGSPGRVKYLIQKSKLSVQSVRLFVLDEADFLVSQEKMRADVNWICSALPEGRQTIALSATFSTQLSEYVTNYMDSPVHIKMSSKSAVLIGVQQFHHYVSSVKFDGSYSRAKFAAVKEILSSIDFRQCIVFYNNHDKAESLCKELTDWNAEWPVAFISSQIDATKRSTAFAQFRQGKCRILVSSDLICRGADAKDVDLILHLDFPRSVDTYLHRVGRAGRFGGRGVSVGIVALSQEFDLIQKYQEKLNTEIPQMPYPPPRNLITSCDIKLPSCRVGDLVTADAATPSHEVAEGLLIELDEASQPEQPVQIEFSSQSNKPCDDDSATYSDMLASYEDVDRFLNMEKGEAVPQPSLIPSKAEPLVGSPNTSGSLANTSGGRSESSRLAQVYGSTPTSASIDRLVKAYGKSEEQKLATGHEEEYRSSSSATVTATQDNFTFFSPTPAPVFGTPAEVSSGFNMPERRRKLCDQSSQTDDVDYQDVSNVPGLSYIPMPPLMSVGGYSEFAAWLQSHGSLIYAPQATAYLSQQSPCRCSCHFPAENSN